MDTDRLNAAEMIAFILVIVGGLNWLLVGVFDFDLVSAIFGEGSFLARTVFTIVGIAALYMITFVARLRRIRHSGSEAREAHTE